MKSKRTAGSIGRRERREFSAEFVVLHYRVGGGRGGTAARELDSDAARAEIRPTLDRDMVVKRLPWGVGEYGLPMGINRENRTLYSTGDCPVCADSGAVLIFCSKASSELVFYCPLCGVAWSSPPIDRRLDEIHSLEQVAPSGISLPSEDDLVDLKRTRTVNEVEYREWQEDLEPYLAAK